MKKRIISLILVAVMTVLTLASCGFSFLSEDMTNYATFDKENFLKEIAKIVIEDGEFTDKDLEKREKMVLDAIYADLAGVADTSEKFVGKVDDKETEEDESEPKIGEHDLVYYYYFVTDKDGKQFFTDKMKSSTAKVQLGILAPAEDDVLTKGLLAALKDFTFTEDSVYEPITSTEKIEEGMWVYLSYTREYEVKSGDGEVTGTKTETASNHRVQVTKDDPFLNQLIGKTVGSTTITVDNTKVTDGKYSNVKVTYAEKLNVAPIVIPGVILYPEDDYDEKKENTTLYTTTEEKSVDLAGAELTYHVYPASYVTVPEYTVENLVNDVYGGNKMTIANVATMLFGEEYTEANEAEDATAALDALYKAYNEKFEKDGEKLGLKEFVLALSTAQKAYDTAETALEKAEDEFETAAKALDDAIKAYNDAKKASTEADDAKKAAEKAYKAAQDATVEAKKNADDTAAYNAAKAEYDSAVANAEHKKALETAEADVKTKTDAVKKAQTAYDKIKDDTEATDKEKEEKKTALDDAKAALTTAEEALKNTVIKQKEAAWAKTAIRAAELKEAEALAEKNSKTTAAESKAKTLSEKSSALSGAKNTYVIKRGNLDGTPDYMLTPADKDYEAKKAAYDKALEQLLAVNEKTDATAAEKKSAREAFIAARVAFAVDPGKDDDGNVRENPAETAACPGDSNYKEKGAEYDYDKALTERDTLYDEFIKVVGDKKLLEGYEYNIVYRELEDAYIKEIRTAIIDKIYNVAIKANTTFKEPPASLVGDTFDRLMDNYQYCFYEEYDVKNLIPGGGASADKTVKDGETYFDRFGGSFEKFMVELAVPTTISGAAPKSYAEAEALVKARAVTIVNEKVRVFAAAEALGVKVTEEQFDAFLEEEGYENLTDETLDDLKITYQLKVLLDHLLDSEEKKDETVKDTYVPTRVTYNGFELVVE